MINNLPYLPGQLTPTLEDVVWEFVAEVKRKGKYPIRQLAEMVRADPISSAAVMVKANRAIALVGVYKHSVEDVQNFPSGAYSATEFIRSCFDSMEGSLTDVILKMAAQAYALGRSVAEIVWSTELEGYTGELRIKRINILDSDRIRFAGRKGEIDRVFYRSGKREIAVPYSKCLHIYNSAIDDNNPDGDPQAAKAFPYWEAHKLIMREWAIAAERQATGLTIVKAASGETVTDMDKLGNPIRTESGELKKISALDFAVRQLQDLRNGSIAGTDKNNDIITVPQTGGEGFFNLTTEKLDKYRWLAFGIPWTIFNEGSAILGQAGLNFGHRMIMDTQIEGIALQFKDRLINNICRPLLAWNFGIRDNFGTFEPEQFLDPAQSGMRVSNLMTCLQTGVFDQGDLEALNQLRKDLGLSAKRQDQFNKELMIKLQAQQQAQQQQQATEGGDTGQENPYL